ncbi:unnamed protein product [Leuciscus chuanchicus]
MKVKERKKERRKLKLTVGSWSPWRFSYATAAPSPAFISHPDIYVQPGRSVRQSRPGKEREEGQGPRLKQNSLQGEPGYEPHILLREQPKITKEGWLRDLALARNVWPACQLRPGPIRDSDL